VTADIDQATLVAVQRFLYSEARLADAAKYSEWLALWQDSDIVYWVAPREDVDPTMEVSYVFDDRALLEQRVARWESGFAWSQVPRSLTSRIVGNVDVVANDGDAVTAVATVHVWVARRGTSMFLAQRVTYVLGKRAAGFVIREKKVVLVDPDTPVGNITFVL
jgi:3-phenylpropionate/cinnamic acid dioxygenase small subunit